MEIKSYKLKKLLFLAAILFGNISACFSETEGTPRWDSVFLEDFPIVKESSPEENYLKHALFFFYTKDYIKTLITIKHYKLLSDKIEKSEPSLFEKTQTLYNAALVALNMPKIALSSLEHYLKKNNVNSNNIDFLYRTLILTAKELYNYNSNELFKQSTNLASTLEKNLKESNSINHQYKDFLISQYESRQNNHHKIKITSKKETDPLSLNQSIINKKWEKQKYLLPISELNPDSLQSINLHNIGLSYFRKGEYKKAINLFRKSDQILEKNQGQIWNSTNTTKAEHEIKSNNRLFTIKSYYLMDDHNKVINTTSINQDNISELNIAGWSASSLENNDLAFKYWKKVSMSKDWSFDKIEALSLLPSLQIETSPESALNGFLAAENAIKTSIFEFKKAKEILKQDNLIEILSKSVKLHSKEKSDITAKQILKMSLERGHILLLKKYDFWKKIEQHIASKKSLYKDALKEWNVFINLSKNLISKQMSISIQKDIDHLEDLLSNIKLSIIHVYEKSQTEGASDSE